MKGDALAFDLGGRLTEAVVTDRPQAAGQDVAELTDDEFDAFNCLAADGVAVCAVFPAETHLAIADRYNSRVADGGATDIGSEVFDDTFAAAEGLEIHPPVFLPDGGIDGWK